MHETAIKKACIFLRNYKYHKTIGSKYKKGVNEILLKPAAVIGFTIKFY